MPLNPLAPGVFSSALTLLKEEPALPMIKALGQRPGLDEGAELGPPPAATNRAETAFEAMGIFLVLLIGCAAAWILIRQRL